MAEEASHQRNISSFKLDAPIIVKVDIVVNDLVSLRNLLLRWHTSFHVLTQKV